MISCIFYALTYDKDCTNILYKQMHTLMERVGGRTRSTFLGHGQKLISFCSGNRMQLGSTERYYSIW